MDISDEAPANLACVPIVFQRTINMSHPTRVSLTNLVSEEENVRATQTGASAELGLPGLVHTEGSATVAILWTLRDV